HVRRSGLPRALTGNTAVRGADSQFGLEEFGILARIPTQRLCAAKRDPGVAMDHLEVRRRGPAIPLGFHISPSSPSRMEILVCRTQCRFLYELLRNTTTF